MPSNLGIIKYSNVFILLFLPPSKIFSEIFGSYTKNQLEK